MACRLASRTTRYHRRRGTDGLDYGHLRGRAVPAMAGTRIVGAPPALLLVPRTVGGIIRLPGVAGDAIAAAGVIGDAVHWLPPTYFGLAERAQAERHEVALVSGERRYWGCHGDSVTASKASAISNLLAAKRSLLER